MFNSIQLPSSDLRHSFGETLRSDVTNSKHFRERVINRKGKFFHAQLLLGSPGLTIFKMTIFFLLNFGALLIGYSGKTKITPKKIVFL